MSAKSTVLLLLLIVVIPPVFQQQTPTKTPFILQTPVTSVLVIVSCHIVVTLCRGYRCAYPTVDSTKKDGIFAFVDLIKQEIQRQICETAV